MSMIDATQRQLRQALAGMVPPRPPAELYDAVMDGVVATTQRGGWRVTSTARLGPGARGAVPLRFAEAARLVLLVVALLVIAVVGALLAGGGGPIPLPSPLATPTAFAGRSPAPARTFDQTPGPLLPGEAWILYERFTQMGGGLFVMRPDGTESHRILSDIPGVHKDADWSPEGNQIAFIDEQTEYLWIATPDGSAQRRVAYCETRPGCAHPAWSPDGTRIAFTVADNIVGIEAPAAVGIYVLDLATDVVTPIITLERPLLADVPRWSPDGTELVFGVDQMDEDAFETGATIAIVPVGGGAVRYLTPLSQFAYQPDWNRVDRSILFSEQVREFMASPVPSDTWNIFVLQPDGTGLRRVTDVATGTRLWFPTFTPDGTHIIAADQGRRLAVLVDPQTGSVEPIGGSDLARPLLRPLP